MCVDDNEILCVLLVVTYTKRNGAAQMHTLRCNCNDDDYDDDRIARECVTSDILCEHVCGNRVCRTVWMYLQSLFR